MFRPALLSLLLLSGWIPSRAATIHCVTDEVQLRAVFATLSGISSGDHDVRLTRRVFFNGTQTFSIVVTGQLNDIRISGGWDSGCNSQTPDARETVIDAQGLSAVLSIHRSSAVVGTAPLVAVSNLTLRNGTAASAPVGLHIINNYGSIEVDNVIVHGHRATASIYDGGTAITLDTPIGDIRLRNALVFDNEGWLQFNSQWQLADVLLTSMSLNPNRQFVVTNSTIDAGPGEPDRALRLQSDGHLDLFNNVIKGPVYLIGSITGAGAATPPKVRRVFNHMPNPVSDPGVVVDLDSGNSTADPQLDPATFVPLAGSPVVNAGLGNPPGGESLTDVHGHPRTAFTYIDQGAIEAQTYVPTVRIFGDDFE